MTQIIWDKNIDEANKKEVEQYLQPFAWVIPAWLQRLNIYLYTTERDTLAANIQVKERYREATLNIYSNWFICTELEKADVILHELLHLHTNPLYDFAKNALRNAGIANPETVFDEMECYLERQTQDLAFAIYQKFNVQRD